MKLTDMEMAHSVELEIMHDGKKTVLLTSVEGMIGNSVLLTPIHLDGKIVGFAAYLTVNLLYPEEDQLYCWSNIHVKAVRYRGHIYHSVELQGSAFPVNRRGAYRVFIGETRFIYHRNQTDTKMYEILLRDISETGMCYMSKTISKSVAQSTFSYVLPAAMNSLFGQKFCGNAKIQTAAPLSFTAANLWKRANI